MNVLPFTLLILALLGIMVAARWHQSVEDELVHQSLLAESQSRRAISNLQERRDFEAQRTYKLTPNSAVDYRNFRERQWNRSPMPGLPEVEEGKEPIYPGVGVGEFLLTERLNLALAFSRDIPKEEQELYRRLTDRIISHIYEPIYGQEPLRRLLARLDEVTSRLAKESPKRLPTRDVEMASLDLEDQELQRLWYFLLKGRRKKHPSLLEFCTWNPRGGRQLQLFRMPDEAVAAILDDRQTATNILKKRYDLLERFCADKEVKAEIEESFRMFVERRLQGSVELSELMPIFAYEIEAADWDRPQMVTDELGRAVSSKSADGTWERPARVRRLASTSPPKSFGL